MGRQQHTWIRTDVATPTAATVPRIVGVPNDYGREGRCFPVVNSIFNSGRVVESFVESDTDTVTGIHDGNVPEEGESDPEMVGGGKLTPGGAREQRQR